MSVNQEQFEEALAAYVNVQATIDDLKSKLKEPAKTQRTAKKIIQTYMSQNNMSELTTGATTFNLVVKEACPVSMDRMEASLGPQAADKYREVNLEQKESMKIKHKKSSRGSSKRTQ